MGDEAKTPAFPIPRVTRLVAAQPLRISLGDEAEVRLEPGVLDFLATPYPNEHGERPGKHLHPFSGIPLGLAIEAGIRACQGKELGIGILRAAEVEFTAPLHLGEVVHAVGRVVLAGRRCLHCRVEVFAGEERRLILRGKVVLVKVQDGEAMDLGPLIAR